MASPSNEWLSEFDRLAAPRMVLFDDYVAAWQRYRDGLTPAEAVAAIMREKDADNENVG